MSELVLHVKKNWGINYADADGDRASAPQGAVIQFGLSNVISLLAAAKQGHGVIRLSTPNDRVIQAPKPRRAEPWTVETVKEKHGGRTPSGEPSLLHRRALQLIVEAPLLLSDVTTVPIEGVQSYLDLAACLMASELNATISDAKQKALAALDEARAYPARLEEIELEQVKAEAEAKTAAAKARLKAAKAVADSWTSEELRDELEQAQAQLEAFERGNANQKQMELAQARLEKARKALDDRQLEDDGKAARAILKPLLAQFDVAHKSIAERAAPIVEVAQAALQAGDFGEVHRLAEQIRQALAPQVDWKTKTVPMMAGPHVGFT